LHRPQPRRQPRSDGSSADPFNTLSEFGRKRYRSHDSRGVLPSKRAIAERPAEVDARRRLGHWEGDTVMGSDLRHCVLTLVERKTGYAIIKKLTARNKDQLTRAATVPFAATATTSRR
jgi:IS30 family transposase